MSFERNRPPAQFTNNIRQFQEQQNPHVQLCFKTFKWIPVVFITAVLGWSYYAYVVQLCFSEYTIARYNATLASHRSTHPLLTLPVTVTTTAERIILIALFHVFFTMFIWAYFQTIFTQIGVVPKKVLYSIRNRISGYLPL